MKGEVGMEEEVLISKGKSKREGSRQWEIRGEEEEKAIVVGLKDLLSSCPRFTSPQPALRISVCTVGCQVLLCEALSHPGRQHPLLCAWGSSVGWSWGRVGLRVCNEFPCLDPQLHEELPQEQPLSRIPFFPSLIQLFSSPSSFSLSANAQQMGGNAILNATAS